MWCQKMVCHMRTQHKPAHLSPLLILLKALILKVKVSQSCQTLCDPMGYRLHGILQARMLEWVAFPFSRGSSQPRDPRSPPLQADSLPAEPPGKSKNTGVGSLSLLQRTFPTQESNQGLLHCGQILYQLSYQGLGLCQFCHLRLALIFIFRGHLCSEQVFSAAS